jgi:hypothetical protein
MEVWRQKLNLSSCVTFHGFVVMDLLVATRFAIFFNAVAMRCHRPTKLSRCGSGGDAAQCGAQQIRAFKQVVTAGVNGRLIPVGDVKALAAAIVDAWENCESLGRLRSKRELTGDVDEGIVRERCLCRQKSNMTKASLPRIFLRGFSVCYGQGRTKELCRTSRIPRTKPESCLWG